MYALVPGDGDLLSLRDHGIVGASNVILYAKISGKATIVGSAVVSNSGVEDSSDMQRRLHGTDLPTSDEEDLVVIRATKIYSEHHSIPYPYTFHTTDGVPSNLGELFTAGMYASDTNAMKAVEEAASAMDSEDADDVVISGIDMTPLATMVSAKVGNEDDVANVSSEFETGSGRRVTVRRFDH